MAPRLASILPWGFSLALIFLTQPSLTLAQVSQNTMDQAPPQYELGLGVLFLNTPDYPGSENSQLRWIPFPYYIYRGEYLRADDEGTRARLLSSQRFETGVSLGFNFPVDSADNAPRQGMPDLDTLLSIGPRLLYRLITGSPRHKLNLVLATRGVFSTQWRFSHLLQGQGLVFDQGLNYWYRWNRSKTTFFSALGMEFGTAKYARFFYNVPQTLATASRPEYVARPGLMETSLSLGLGQQLSREWFMFLGGSLRSLEGASNQESALVVNRYNFSFILGFVWTLFESPEKVKGP